MADAFQSDAFQTNAFQIGGGSDVTVALTGQSATASAGTLAPDAAVGLAGSGATAEPGALVPALSFGLTGIEGIAAAGDIAQSRTVPLAGVESASQQGNIGVVGDVTVALTGQSMTMAQGVLVRLADAAEQASGGFYEVPEVRRRRSVQEERKRLGITTEEVKQLVVAVAKQTVQAVKTDAEAQRVLARALAEENVRNQAAHEMLLRRERDRLLSRDVALAMAIRRKQEADDEDEREAEMLLM